MFGLFALATLLWGYALRSQRSAVQNIHWLMLALVVLKTLTVFAEALMYHFINIHGRPDGWNIVFYILTAGRGLLFFVVIILIGTGWSYMRPFLDDNTKKVLMVVLPLQVRQKSQGEGGSVQGEGGVRRGRAGGGRCAPACTQWTSSRGGGQLLNPLCEVAVGGGQG
jgi:hypothetical protein